MSRTKMVFLKVCSISLFWSDFSTRKRSHFEILNVVYAYSQQALYNYGAKYIMKFRTYMDFLKCLDIWSPRGLYCSVQLVKLTFEGLSSFLISQTEQLILDSSTGNSTPTPTSLETLGEEKGWGKFFFFSPTQVPPSYLVIVKRVACSGG